MPPTSVPGSRDECPAPRHGSRNAYAGAGCRCPDARRADTRYAALRAMGVLPPRHVASAGTARRLQGLLAQGHTGLSLAGHLGWGHRRVSELAHQRYPTVHVDTAAAVTHLCEILADEPAPQGVMADRNRRHAAARGWVTIQAWRDAWADIDDPADQLTPPDSDLPDDVVVRRIVAGRPLARPASLVDRRAAALVLLQHGATRARAAQQAQLRWSIVVELAGTLAA
jgi:hypothetical protein